MIRVGYFCTAGHTEVGGIDRFLNRIASEPEVRWERCFPAVRKPAPKIGKPGLERPAPKGREGLTGASLVSEMMERLAEYHRAGSKGALDAVVFIDDADCRFEGDPAKVEAWTGARAAEVRAKTGAPSIPFVALFASPEIEAWFLADWEQGFGVEYDKLATGERHLRAHVEELLGSAIGSVEGYGGGLVNGACANKLSEKLQGLVTRLGGAYSKRMQGQDMLLRIRPEKVAQECGAYFRPALQALRRAIAEAREQAAAAQAARTQS